MSFCPCWSSKVLANFDEPKALARVPVSEGVDPAQEGDALEKPTAAECGGEAAKEFLVALETVAQLIPLPGVSTAVKIAKNIMQACDESHATLERAEELKLRIKKLVIILVDELKEKKDQEIQAKLREDIEELSIDLQYIQGKLNDIASQNALLLIIFRGLNEEKVKKCVGRLDNSLTNFSLVRQINDAKFLETLEKKILAFHTSHQKSLDEMHGKVDLLQATMNDVKGILEERSDLVTTSQPHLRAAIPANGGVFHGRDPLVAQLVHILTSNSDTTKRPRVCLLGPGGMGKTSTALAVMAHPEMRECFPEQNQVWVPCVKATSVALFLDTLYSSLGTKKNSGNTLKDIKSEITSSADPLILLLDNFETPWNLLESRSETEQILYELDQISTIVLFITMRSSIPPCHGSQWQSVDVEAVDEEAARRIYLDICSAGSDDGDLSELLQTLGCMPLAITLMANMARMTGLGAGKLLQEYKRIGTSMLRQGADAKRNLDICISLSVDSPPMKAHPEAYELLSTLATLPVGTTYDVLTKWWLRHSPNLVSALQVLAETSLIQRRVTNYFVLPVIRSFILDPSRFPSKIRTMTISSACDFLTHHDSLAGEPSYKAHADAISAEEGNLQAILLDATDPEPQLVQALLVLARYQLSTRPRLEVIEHALKLVRQIASHRGLVGDALTCYGRILTHFDRYDEAREQLNLAREAFLSVPDEQRAARCFLYLAELPFKPGAGTTDRETKLQSLIDAKAVFEKLGDTQGIALSLYYLGKVNGRHGNHTEGIELLIRAQAIFQDRGDVLNRARCSLNLEHIYFWARRYDEALLAGTTAIQDYNQLGQYAGGPMYFLGKILLAKGDYPAALEISIQALGVCKAYGRRRHIGETLQVIGRIWAKMGQIVDAQGAYAEAVRCYGTHVGDLGKRSEDFVTTNEFLSRQADTPDLVPTDEERTALLRYFSDFTDVSHHSFGYLDFI